jgi:hypothetical protein
MSSAERGIRWPTITPECFDHIRRIQRYFDSMPRSNWDLAKYRTTRGVDKIKTCSILSESSKYKDQKPNGAMDRGKRGQSDD